VLRSELNFSGSLNRNGGYLKILQPTQKPASTIPAFSMGNPANAALARFAWTLNQGWPLPAVSGTSTRNAHAHHSICSLKRNYWFKGIVCLHKHRRVIKKN